MRTGLGFEVRRGAMIGAGLFAVACTTSAGIEAPNPRAASWRGPVLLSCSENGGSVELLGLPNDSMVSDVALLRADAESACFDVKMRTWKGAAPTWDVSLAVDGSTRDEAPAFLDACTIGSLTTEEYAPGPGKRLACVPEDSILLPRETDALPELMVRGDRFCLSHGGALGAGAHELTLELRQGAYGFRFDFHLKDDAWVTARATALAR